MAVAVNLFPVTGQPLPLLSMGGTSICFTSIAIGMIMSVSRSLKETPEAELANA
jgi:cell division protein FtsW